MHLYLCTTVEAGALPTKPGLNAALSSWLVICRKYGRGRYRKGEKFPFPSGFLGWTNDHVKRRQIDKRNEIESHVHRDPPYMCGSETPHAGEV